MGKNLKALPSSNTSANNNDGPKNYAKEMVVWSEPMNEYLIDSLLHQQAIGNRSEGKFSTMAYQNIILGVHEKFGVQIDRSNIKNRLKSIKDNFHECENLFGQESGFSWSPMTKKWNAEPQVWKEFLEAKPEAKRWMTKTINHYDRLVELFGKDRVKRPAVESPKETPKKKVRKEPPKEKIQRIRSNGFESTGAESTNRTVNEKEVPDEMVTKKNRFEELDLSEVCRTGTSIVAVPVPANAYGKGLPYAPIDWPCPGDIWSWKVGCRVSTSGHWVDRYLTPPSRFRDATGKKSAFQSRLQVEEYIKREYPDVDPSTFFSMFIWKIPAEGHKSQKGIEQVRLYEPESYLTDPTGPCKARNKLCRLEKEGTVESSSTHDCDICCTYPTFCRECCCILCHRTVDYSFGGFSYIKCEAIVEENNNCGHLAHIDCALRCYMAGTVGGSIGLDVQYYCRRCDKKTDLMRHVDQLVETCRSLESRDEIEPILNMGLCLLRGSKQMRAKSLENYMGSAMAKLKCGVDLVEVWKMEDDTPVLSAGEISPPTSGVTVLGAQQVSQDDELMGHADIIDSIIDHEMNSAVAHMPVYITSDHDNMSVKLEDDIDRALQKLKRSQESEYRLAEQKLYSQKDFLLGLYEQLESERSELADPNPLSNGANYGALLSNILNRADQIKKGEEKFRAMMKVADGFGKTPASVLKEHFGLSADK